MKKLLASLLSFATALLIPSCFEYETNITVNKDGSGTITEETVFGQEALGFLEMAAQQGGEGKNPLNDLKDAEKAKAKASGYGEGVTFVKIEEIARNGGKGVRVTYKFDDISKISLNPGEGLTNMAPGTAAKAEETSTAIKFAFAGDTLTIISPEVDAEKAKEAADDLEIPDTNDPQAEMMMQMMKGMKMTAKITVADGIAKTDATYHEGNTITVYEMNFDEILANPKGLMALKGIDMSNRAEAATALTKIDGVKAETKEKVTVTLK